VSSTEPNISLTWQEIIEMLRVHDGTARINFCRYAAEILEDRLNALEKRLEVYSAPDKNGDRMFLDIGSCDGIGCRDCTIEMLQNHVDNLRQQKMDSLAMANKYNELLMAVATKTKGENRHGTALRYIQQVEVVNDDARKSGDDVGEKYDG